MSKVSNKKCCKVAPFYFGKNRRADPRTWEQGKSLLEYRLANESSVDPGVEVDLIIVNNVQDSKEAVDYLNSIDGKKTKTGKIRVLHRENIGISFGAYNHAFENFRDDYDYWLFLEDDLFTNLENYYAQFLEQLEEDDNLAYVALVGVGSQNTPSAHAHNGAGCTSKKYLDLIYDERGSLPYHNAPGLPSPDTTNTAQRQAFWKKHCIGGEVAFTNAYVQKGYRIEKFRGEKPYIRWIKGNSERGDLRDWGRCDFVHDKPYDFM